MHKYRYIFKKKKTFSNSQQSADVIIQGRQLIAFCNHFINEYSIRNLTVFATRLYCRNPLFKKKNKSYEHWQICYGNERYFRRNKKTCRFVYFHHAKCRFVDYGNQHSSESAQRDNNMHRGNNMFSIRRKIQKQVSPFHCVASDPLASSLYLRRKMS